MTPKKIISTAALALMLTAGVAAAQTTYPTTNTGTDQTTLTNTAASTTGSASDMTGTTGSSTGTIPGTPNTGAGGDATSTLLTLIASAFAAIVGAVYLVTRKTLAR